MKHTRAAILAGLTLTAASVGAYVPAHANNNTIATFTIASAGGLAINAPQSADLGTYKSGDVLVSGPLGTVSVTDKRGALLGNWTVNASATRDFEYTSPNNTPTPAHNVSKALATYITGTVTAAEGLGVGAGAGGLLAAPVIAATRVGVGNNEASWSPTITVPLSAQAPVGTYATTIVHSFA